MTIADIALLIAILIPIGYVGLLFIVWATLTTGAIACDHAVAIAPRTTKWIVRLTYHLRWGVR